MISRVEGILERVTDASVAELRVGDVWHEVLIPGCDHQRLSSQVRRRVTFHTLEYLEGSAQGASFIPRLIGFASPRDREFFQLFTTVKGIGNRKALRALQLPFAQVAEAIAGRDIKLLQSLPEIGKRSAETICAELGGKVDRFVETGVPSRDGRGGEVDEKARIADQALAVLLALGEPRLEMLQLVNRAMSADPELETPESVVTAVYRLRE